MRAYVDTSVFGGVFDSEFSEPSRTFFEQVREGRFVVVVSDVTSREIESAPPPVRAFFEEMIEFMESPVPDRRVLEPRNAYMAAGVLGPARMDDAAHVAAATVGGCDIIVSWNFKHMVNVDKIRLFGGVNALNGYPPMDIRSPAEVVRYEEEI